MKRAAKWATGIAAILLGAWMIAAVLNIAATQAESREQRAALAAEVNELDEQSAANAAALDIANDRLRRAGKTPVDEPEPGEDLPEVIEGEPGVDGKDGARGEPGPRGPSCVEDIGRTACRGDQGGSGAPGAPGQAGSDGEAGATGDKGDKGDPGPAGPAGPVGPAGPQGERGPAGADGTMPSGSAGCPEGQYVVSLTYGPDGLSVVCATPALVPLG